jgi:sphingomyelin phosphodiesterase 2
MAHLRLLTLNTWGAPYAKSIPSRMVAIARHILQLSPDIVCLQEVFLPDMRDLILRELSAVYPYHQSYTNGLLGSGLLTLSKYPIIDANFLSFRLSGKPEDIKHGDYYVAKGVGMARIQTPNGVLDVYNVHPHAQYEPQEDNEYAVYTHAQLYETVRFVHAHSPANPTVLCGDFNTQPHQLGYRIVTSGGLFYDAFFALNPHEQRITFDAQNPYVASESQCLDYVFLKGKLTADSVTLCFTETFQNADYLAYTDHYGLLAELTFAEQPLTVVPEAPLGNIAKALLKQLQQEHALTLTARMKHIERLGIALASLLDIAFTRRVILRNNPSLSRLFARVSLLAVLVYAGFHALNIFVNLRARRNVLSTLTQELHHQVQARRWFDGRPLDDVR